RAAGSLGLHSHLRAITLAAVAFIGAVAGIMIASGQSDPALLPRLGETSKEYESRIRGVVIREIPAPVMLMADARGHYSVDTKVNGAPIRMMIDTGASLVVLSERDAHNVGIRPAAGEFTEKSSTANGVVPVA